MRASCSAIVSRAVGSTSPPSASAGPPRGRRLATQSAGSLLVSSRFEDDVCGTDQLGSARLHALRASGSHVVDPLSKYRQPTSAADWVYAPACRIPIAEPPELLAAWRCEAQPEADEVEQGNPCWETGGADCSLVLASGKLIVPSPCAAPPHDLLGRHATPAANVVPRSFPSGATAAGGGGLGVRSFRSTGGEQQRSSNPKPMTPLSQEGGCPCQGV